VSDLQNLMAVERKIKRLEMRIHELELDVTVLVDQVEYYKNKAKTAALVPGLRNELRGLHVRIESLTARLAEYSAKAEELGS